MFKRKSKNVITFSHEPGWEDVYPKPIPAVKGMPDFFKKLDPFLDKMDPQSSTAKKCIPFIDAMTAGYIIPLWADLHVIAQGDDLRAEFSKNMPMRESISGHPEKQLKDHPYTDSYLSSNALKLHNPWVITTPKGWSCYFLPLINHFERRFQPISASVDTDTYYNEINFPMLWTGGEGEFVIKRGTPFVHVIPYKRDTLSLEIGTTDIAKRDSVFRRLGTYLNSAYRNEFWHKRRDK